MSANLENQPVKASLETINRIKEEIRKHGKIPAGTVFVKFSDVMSHDTFRKCIDILKHAGVIEEDANTMIHWIGEEEPDPDRDIYLCVGDVIRSQGGLVLIDRATDSGARCIPLNGIPRTIRPALGEEKTIVTYGEKFQISLINTACNIVARLGEDWMNTDFSVEVPGFDGKPVNLRELERLNKMATNTKKRGGLAEGAAETFGDKAAATSTKEKKAKTKKPKAPKAKAEKKEATPGSRGSLGSLFNCSVTSVIRLLGKKGCSSARVRAIFDEAAKEKIVSEKPNPATIQIQTSKGRRGEGGDVAELTGAQLKQLMDLAGEPKDESSDKPKAKKKAKKPKAEKTPEVPSDVPEAVATSVVE